ncbi:MAG: carbohydrate deacetylase [Candidatus Binatia bacterium]
MESARRVIITADDYGMCDAVNEAIEKCLETGMVRATCAMMNMPAYGATASLRKQFPQSSIGIPWNVTQGRPVLPASQVSSLVNGNGLFYPAAELKRRWLSGKAELSELQSELRAQFERLNQIMGRPDFWNTHQNVHVFPGLFQTFVKIGRELSIRAMRCHRRITVPRGTSELAYNLSHPQYWLKGQVIAWWSNRSEAKGTLMPDARLYMPGYTASVGLVEEVFNRLQWNTVKKAVEVVIHPATTVHEDLFGRLTESRVAEYNTFKNPKLLKRLRQSGIEPVGFEALRPLRNS